MKRISNLHPIYDDSDMTAAVVVGFVLGIVTGGVAAAALFIWPF